MLRSFQCGLCGQRDRRGSLFCPCACQADNKKNEDNGLVHRHCLEELLRARQGDLEAGEAPHCPVCLSPYDITLETTFLCRLSSLLSCASLYRVVEMFFYLIFLVFFLVIVSSLYYDMSHHPVVVLGFVLCCVHAVRNMYDTILVKIYKSWVFFNSIISVKMRKPGTSS